MPNTVPGLRTTGDRASLGGRIRPRVQVNTNTRMPELRPAARPVDQYFRPEAPAQGPNELAQLANALATISPDLNSFLTAEATQQRKDAEDRANRRIGGMTFEESQSALRDGTLTELDNPWFKAAYMKQYGERLAYQRMNELTTKYETAVDKGSLNFDQFVAEQMKTDLDEFGDNKFFVSSYQAAMQNFNAKGGAAHQQYLTTQAVEETKGGVYETFLGSAREQLAAGVPPDQIVASLRSRYDANRTMLHMDYKAQDAELVSVAQALAAEGQLDLVNAILMTPRTGTDGTQLGTLADNRTFAADAARIITSAKTKKAELDATANFARRTDYVNAASEGNLDVAQFTSYYEANPEGSGYTEAGFRSILAMNQSAIERVQAEAATNDEKLRLVATARQAEAELLEQNVAQLPKGGVAFLVPQTLPTDNGGTKAVSVEDQKKALAEYVTKQAQSLAAERKLTPEQAFDLEVSMFATNGLENPVWKNTLATGLSAANAWALGDGGDVPPALKQGAELYEQLQAKAPAMLGKHLDEDALDFFEAYRIAHQDMRMGEDAAYRQAIIVTRDPTKFDNPYYRQKFEDIDNAVASTRQGFWIIPGAPAENETLAAGYISKTAKMLVRSDVNPPKAIELATERFKQNHTNINGHWVNTASRDIPPDFSSAVTGVIEDYVAAHPDEGLEASDLTVQALGNGNGAWRLIQKNGLPVEDAGARDLTLQSIYTAKQARDEATKAKLAAETNAKLDDAAAAPAREAAEAARTARNLEAAEFFDPTAPIGLIK